MLDSTSKSLGITEVKSRSTVKQTNSLKVYKTVYRIWADGSVGKSTYCENKRTGAQIPSTTEKPGKAIMPVIPALGVETRILGD